MRAAKRARIENVIPWRDMTRDLLAMVLSKVDFSARHAAASSCVAWSYAARLAETRAKAVEFALTVFMESAQALPKLTADRVKRTGVQCPNAQSLSIRGWYINPHVFDEAAKAWPTLTKLELDSMFDYLWNPNRFTLSCPVLAGLVVREAVAAWPRLSTLILRNVGIGVLKSSMPVLLNAVAAAKNLEHLEIWIDRGELPGQGILNIVKQNPGIRVLALNHLDILDNGMKELFSGLPKLRELYLDAFYWFQVHHLADLGNSCPNLRYLDVERCIFEPGDTPDVIDQALQTLRTGCPHLRTFRFDLDDHSEAFPKTVTKMMADGVRFQYSRRHASTWKENHPTGVTNVRC